MRDEGIVVVVLERRQAQQAGVIPGVADERRFAHGLFRAAADTGDLDDLATVVADILIDGFAADAQHLFEQAKSRVADFELRRVHADGDAAGAGVEVVSGQGALVALVELSVDVQRQRMRRDHRARSDG